MDIKKDFRNELLKRQEISFVLEHDKTPSFSEMEKLISEEFKKPIDTIDVYNIKGKFGRKTFLIKAYIYDSPEILLKMKEISKTKKQRDAEKKEIENIKKNSDDSKKE
ncbi:MAG: hypothetical protein QXW97_02810 [Candidatus Pacearchaeota archaeon]